MHFCNGGLAECAFSFLANLLFTVTYRGWPAGRIIKRTRIMDRITQTLATVINVLFVAGVFGAMTVALGSTFA